MDEEHWPTEAEAAVLLRTSRKTIMRDAAKGLIEIRKRPRPGKKPVNICNPDDLDKLKPPAHVLPESEPMNGNGLARASGEERLTFAYVLQQLLQRTAPPAPLPEPKLWLTLEEASDFSGLGPRVLKRLCRDHKLTALKARGEGWRVLRKSLEAFEG